MIYRLCPDPDDFEAIRNEKEQKARTGVAKRKAPEEELTSKRTRGASSSVTPSTTIDVTGDDPEDTDGTQKPEGTQQASGSAAPSPKGVPKLASKAAKGAAKAVKGVVKGPTLLPSGVLLTPLKNQAIPSRLSQASIVASPSGGMALKQSSSQDSGKALPVKKSVTFAQGDAPIPGRDPCLPYYFAVMFPFSTTTPVSEWRTLFPTDVLQFPGDSAIGDDRKKVTLLREPTTKDFSSEYATEIARLSEIHFQSDAVGHPPYPDASFTATQTDRVKAAWAKLQKDAEYLLSLEIVDKELEESKAAKEREAAIKRAAEREAATQKEATAREDAKQKDATAKGSTSKILTELMSPPLVSQCRKVEDALGCDDVEISHMFARFLEEITYQSDVIEALHRRLRTAEMAGQRLSFIKFMADQVWSGKTEPINSDWTAKIVAIAAYLEPFLKVGTMLLFVSYHIFLITK